MPDSAPATPTTEHPLKPFPEQIRNLEDERARIEDKIQRLKKLLEKAPLKGSPEAHAISEALGPMVKALEELTRRLATGLSAEVQKELTALDAALANPPGLALPGAFDRQMHDLEEERRKIDEKIAYLKKLVEGLPPDARRRHRLEGRIRAAQRELDRIGRYMVARLGEDLDREVADLGRRVRLPFVPTPPPKPGPAGAGGNQGAPAGGTPPGGGGTPPGGGGGGSGSGGGGAGAGGSGSGGGSGDSGSGNPQAGTGAVDASIPDSDRKRLSVEVAKRDYIFARSERTVWVWDPFALQWGARLDTGGTIVELSAVDGTVAVRTDAKLWLFHPTQFAWIGELDATVEEVVAREVSYPIVVSRPEGGQGQGSG